MISQDDLDTLLGGLSVGETEEVSRHVEEELTANGETISQDDMDKLFGLYGK